MIKNGSGLYGGTLPECRTLHLTWTVKESKNVISPDETIISRIESFVIKFCCKKTCNKRILPHQTKKTKQGDGGKVMTWGCITVILPRIWSAASQCGTQDGKTQDSVRTHIHNIRHRGYEYYNCEKLDLLPTFGPLCRVPFGASRAATCCTSCDK